MTTTEPGRVRGDTAGRMRAAITKIQRADAELEVLRHSDDPRLLRLVGLWSDFTAMADAIEG